MENKVIGTVFGMKEGQISKPIVGNAATFVVKLDKLTPAPQPSNYNQLMKEMGTAFTQRVFQGYPYIALKKASDIQDYRIKFY